MHHNERIPNVQTIDDLLIEKCQPGDVILFDRRCECCASGAMAALACVLGKAALCNEDDGTRSVEKGSYEHCGELLVKIMFILNKTISRTVHSAMNRHCGTGVLNSSWSTTRSVQPVSSRGYIRIWNRMQTSLDCK